MTSVSKIVICLFFGVLLGGCHGKKEQPLLTRSVTIGENKCIVQRMPSSFHEDMDEEDSRFDYFRVIIESKAKMMDSSHVNYLNFGIENSIKQVVEKDTLFPAFVQRVANGKKENYEYLVSFDKNPAEKNFEILIDDQVFEMGMISVKF